MAEKRTVEQTRNAIHRAIGKGATVQAIADAVELGTTVTGGHLHALAADGIVTSRKDGRVTVWESLQPPPKLRKGDVTTPRAVQHTSAKPAKAAVPFRGGPARDGRNGGGRKKRAQQDPAPVVAELPEEAATDQRAGDSLTGDPQTVWMATKRRGLHYHQVAKGLVDSTVCGRSMRTGVTMPLDEVPDTSTECRECKTARTLAGDEELQQSEDATDLVSVEEPAPEKAPEVSEPVAVPQPPAAAQTPHGGDVGSVLEYLETVRPVSAVPAEPVKGTRPRRARGDQPFAVWGRGELARAITDHMQALPEGEDRTPVAVAHDLNSHDGSVAYTMAGLATTGTLQMTSTKPKRYKAA